MDDTKRTLIQLPFIYCHHYSYFAICVCCCPQEMTLTLRVIRAVDLPAKDLCGTSDPYVKILLLPDKKRKLLTNIKHKNLNPRWNEVFAFEGWSRLAKVPLTSIIPICNRSLHSSSLLRYCGLPKYHLAAFYLLLPSSSLWFIVIIIVDWYS